MKRTRKDRSGHNVPPVFLFTPTSLVTAQEALKFYELVLLQAKVPSARLTFARQTMLIVNKKLAAMRKVAGVAGLTTFDYNEKIVLATAMKLYCIELLAAPVTGQRARKVRECEHIARFALAHLTAVPPGTTQD